MRYCAPKRTHWGWDFSGSSNTEELKQHLTKNMIRRLKDDVLPELPDWRESLIHVDINRKREYRRAEADFIQWYEENVGKAKSQNAKKAEALVRTGQLKKLAAECKLKTMRQWIDDFLEETDGKLVVFCYHRNIFSELQKTYRKIACIGGKSGSERQKQVDTFQTDPKRRIFIGSIRADAEAITLTAASSVLFAEVGWTPKEHDQCRDRARRIGQKSFVNVYYLLGHGTIDTHCYNVVQEKRRLVEDIVDGAVTEKTYGDDVSRLVAKMKGQKKHDQ
jgi:SWI/SNF-related matrix-associated actin-dependent regulator 1 of chromatin subfamily A